jgi:hypothetical protein
MSKPSPEAVEAAIAYAALNHKREAAGKHVINTLTKCVTGELLGTSSALDQTAARILAAEVERLREALHYCNGTADLSMKHRDAAEAEVERLRERVAKLEEVLIPFISLNPLSRQVQALWDDFVQKARATTKESLSVQPATE